MATRSHQRLMTYEEFAALPREGMITMLLDGEYIQLPSPVDRHQELLGRLYLRIGNFLEDHPLGRVLLAPLDVVLSKPRARVIQPDLIFIPKADTSRYENGIIMGSPAFAIEVLSKDAKRYDLGKKLAYYNEYGTAELWHVHQGRPAIDVYRRDEQGSLVKALEVGPGDRLTTPFFPGFDLDVARLFADLP